MTTILDRTFLGVEFRDDSVTLALLKNSVSGMKLVSSGTFALKEESGDAVNEVREFISREGLAISNVFVSIPDRWAITKFTDVPSVKGRSKSAVSNMMKFEIERHIPFPIENVSYDYFVLLKKEGFFSVVFTAVQNEKVDFVKGFLEKLALKPHSITLSSFAVISAVELSGVPAGGLQEVVGITRRSDIFIESDVPSVLLHMNGKNATLSIMKEGLCVSQRTFLLNHDQPSDVYAAKVAQLLSEMRGVLASDRIDKLLVAGDKASFDGMAEGLKKAMAGGSIQVNEIAEFSGDVHGTQMNGLVAAVGACYTGLGIGTHRINILPHKREYEITNLAPLATRVFLVLAVLMLIGMFSAGAVKQKEYIEGLDAAIQENGPAVRALESVTSDIATLKKQSGILYDLRKSELTLEMLAELTSVMPLDSWITNLHYKGRDMKGKKEGGELVISGFASSSSILIPLLEDSPYFEKVEFVGPIKKKGLKEQFKIKAVVLVRSEKENS